MTYTTIQGDTWDGIAYKLYGREKQMTALMAANPDYMAIVIFSPGVTLTVPDASAATTTNLPPWKRRT